MLSPASVSENAMNKECFPLLAGALVSCIALRAEASLTTGLSGGENVVYSSLSDVTWTADANLLGTMMTNQGYSTVVTAIIAASPTIADTGNPYDTPPNSGQHTVSTADFSSTTFGRTSWFGALAFATYMNTIGYAGSNHWRLPSPGAHPQLGYNQTETEFGQLFYTELGGTAGSPIPNTFYFINEQTTGHWLGAEDGTDPSLAYVFVAGGGGAGGQYTDLKSRPSQRDTVWLVSPGNLVTAVPLPAAGWLFGTALAGMGIVARRKISSIITV